MLAHGKFRSIGIMFANRFQDRFVPVKLFDMLTCRAASIKLEGELYAFPIATLRNPDRDIQ